MMEFVLTVLAVALGFMVGSAALFMVVMSKPVIKWYLNKVNKMSAEIMDSMFDQGEQA